jgi:hypothetical protein
MQGFASLGSRTVNTGSLGSRVFSMAMTGRGVHLFLI